MIRAPWSKAQSAFWMLLLISACGAADSPDESGGTADGALVGPAARPLAPLAFDLQTPFVGEAVTQPVSRRVGGYSAFDVLATDMDLDGDMDVLINWHLGEIELFENRPPRLEITNARGADRSGLTLQPDLTSLTANWERDLIDGAQSRGPGIHVWCEHRLNWSLFLVAPQDGQSISLELFCNEETEVQGLLPGESVHDDDQGVSLLLQSGAPARQVRLTHDYPSAWLRIEQGTGGVEPLPYWVGPRASAFQGPTLDLRKSDPHGVAWMQVFGSPEPELVIARGGNRGTLQDPDAPKANRIYTFTGEPTIFEQVDTSKTPLDFARGRGLEWVDVDNDGRQELSLSNRRSPNGLWVATGDWLADSGRFNDRARLHGLSSWEGQASAWCDVDGDGWQDQIFVAKKQLSIQTNPQSGRFTVQPGEPLGLKLPSQYMLRQEGFDKTTLSVFDIDADGALDLWVSSIGQKKFHRVFLRRGDVFEDATAQLGLDTLLGTEATVRVDVDDDGYVDVVALGRKPLLLRNRGGQKFDRVPLSDLMPDLPAGPEPDDRIFAVTAADMDSDGKSDLILVAQERYVGYNRSEHDNRCLQVHLTQTGPNGTYEPIGTLVRVTRDDGCRRVARYGSENRSFVSQTLGPLRFGIAAGTTVIAVDVRWPGEREWTACNLTDGLILRLTR